MRGAKVFLQWSLLRDAHRLPEVDGIVTWHSPSKESAAESKRQVVYCTVRRRAVHCCTRAAVPQPLTVENCREKRHSS